MEKSFKKLIDGYHHFRDKYASGHNSAMAELANKGQHPEFMFIACSDSRVDPALVTQCDPGDMFMVRNVANIVPPYENDKKHHGTSAALEFGICYLKVKHLVILGHSQCGGINALLNANELHQDDFISEWVSILKEKNHPSDVDGCSKQALLRSYENALSFPWIKQRVEEGKLCIHLWFINIEKGEVQQYSFDQKTFKPMS